MARPRTVTDDEILDATMRVVAREGPRRFTLAQVGAEAGISAPGVLKRFESKRALLLALSARSRREPGDALRRAREQHASALDALVEGLAGAMAPVDTPREVALSLDYLALDIADPAFQEHARAFFEAFEAEVRALLDEARRKRELRDVDTAALGRAVEVAFHGSVLAWALRPRGALADALRRDVGAVLAPFRRTRRGPAAPSLRASRPRGAARASLGR